jgi:hypothetical protein
LKEAASILREGTGECGEKWGPPPGDSGGDGNITDFEIGDTMLSGRLLMKSSSCRCSSSLAATCHSRLLVFFFVGQD